MDRAAISAGCARRLLATTQSTRGILFPGGEPAHMARSVSYGCSYDQPRLGKNPIESVRTSFKLGVRGRERAMIPPRTEWQRSRQYVQINAVNVMGCRLHFVGFILKGCIFIGYIFVGYDTVSRMLCVGWLYCEGFVPIMTLGCTSLVTFLRWPFCIRWTSLVPSCRRYFILDFTLFIGCVLYVTAVWCITLLRFTAVYTGYISYATWLVGHISSVSFCQLPFVGYSFVRYFFFALDIVWTAVW